MTENATVRRLMTARRLAAALLVVFLGASAPGLVHAATLSGTYSQLGTGFSAVGTCGSMTGAKLGFTVQNTNLVVGASVSGLPSTCNGAVASITLADVSDVNVAQNTGATVTVSGGTAVFGSLSANPAPGTVTNAYFSLVGP